MPFMENRAQEEAIATLYGPVIVISCPGSGKTTMLIRRINNMIQNGIMPQNILMVTFTNEAANDMRKRYVKIYKKNPGITFCTIHSLCNFILKKEGKEYEIFEGKEKWSFFYNLIKENPKIAEPKKTATNVITEISAIKNNGIDLRIYQPLSCDREAFFDMFSKYEDMKDENKRIDYDDMLIMCRDLLAQDKNALERWQLQFQYIQCDEYQDTNYVQRDILYMLAGEKANLCVVGDDDQSIYRFRGAKSDIMLGFEKDFAGKSPKKILMSINYRSVQSVVDAGGKLIKNNRKRFPKDFISQRGENGETGIVMVSGARNTRQEMNEICNLVKQKHDAGVPYNEMAVLFRTNRQAGIPIQIFAERKIPYCSTEKVESVYDHWLYLDILAYIQLGMGINTRENMLKVLNRPNRFFSKKDFAGIDYDRSDMTAVVAAKYHNTKWRLNSAKEKIDTWMEYFGPGKVTEDTPCKSIFARLGYNGIGYQGRIKDTAEYQGEEYKDVLEKYNLLKEEAEKSGTVGEWLKRAERVKRQVRELNTSGNKDGVQVSTLHKSKGREWKIVFIIDVDKEVIPYKKAETVDDIEEERRLFYVGMTRAKDELYIYYTNKSPFISEI